MVLLFEENPKTWLINNVLSKDNEMALVFILQFNKPVVDDVWEDKVKVKPDPAKLLVIAVFTAVIKSGIV